MKNLILLVGMCLTFLSCNKTEVNLPEPEGEKVSLTVSARQPAGVIGNTISDGTAPVTHLTFIIYSLEGAELQRITQSSTDPEFGDLSISLRKAEYYFVVIGCKGDFGINEYYRQNETPVILPFNSANMQYWQDGPMLEERKYKTVDTFFGSARLRITENQHVTMSLTRIIGKLEVIVQDMSDFWVRIKNEATGYMFWKQTPFGQVNEKYLTVQSVNGVVSVYILQTGSPLQIVVGYGEEIGQQRNFTIRIDKNKRTIVRGNMLNQWVGGFTVTIDDKWIEEPNIVEL